MDELLPCPFCNREPSTVNGTIGCEYIKCQCGAETTDGYFERVAEIWNTRALAPALRVVLDHIEANGLNAEAQGAFRAYDSAFLGSASFAVSGALRAMLAEQEAGDGRS